MRNVSESLAGRATYLTLWPMTRSEQAGLVTCGKWDELLSSPEVEWLDILANDYEEEDWRALVRRDGFPTPAIEMANDSERSVWFEGYVRTYLERDLRALSAVSSLPDYRRLMKAAALCRGATLGRSRPKFTTGEPRLERKSILSLTPTGNSSPSRSRHHRSRVSGIRSVFGLSSTQGRGFFSIQGQRWNV